VLSARAASDQVRPGQEVPVEIRLREYQGGERVRSIVLKVPESVRGDELLVLAGSPQAFFEWDQDRAPEKYRPRDLDDLVRLIQTYPPESQLIVRLYGASRGVVHRGRELSSLPPSKWRALSGAPSGGVTVAVHGVILDEVVVETGSVVLGGTSVQLQIDR
jgi:hypothetical protein